MKLLRLPSPVEAPALASPVAPFCAVPRDGNTWHFVGSDEKSETPRAQEAGVDQAADRSTSTLAAVTVLSVVAILGALVFLRMMNFALRRDEQLYVPPTVLLESKALYADFFYNHVPGSAWLFHAAHVLTGSLSPLLTGRLVVFGAWVLLIGLVLVVARAGTRSWAFAGFLATAFLANAYLHGPVGMAASNNLLPLPFAFAGLALFVLAMHHGDRRPLMVLVAGVLLGLAVSLKASAVAFALPVALGALFLPRAMPFGLRVRSVLVPLVLGGLVGGAPILIYLLQDPETFLAHVVAWHTGPHVAYFAATADPVVLSFAARLELAHSIWFSGANLVLALGTAALAIMAFLRRRELPDAVWQRARGPLVLLAATLAVTAGFALIPAPAFPQYFVQPLIVLPLIAVVLVHVLGSAARRTLPPMLIAAMALMIAAAGPGLVRFIPDIDPKRWTVSTVHEKSRELARLVVGSAMPDGKVATLTPVYPLEGGLPVYDELATGEFAYRSFDLADAKLRALMTSISTDEVADLLGSERPAAILADPAYALDAPLVSFAKANGYRRVEDWTLTDRYGEKSLWLSPRP